MVIDWMVTPNIQYPWLIPHVAVLWKIFDLGSLQEKLDFGFPKQYLISPCFFAGLLSESYGIVNSGDLFLSSFVVVAYLWLEKTTGKLANICWSSAGAGLCHINIHKQYYIVLLLMEKTCTICYIWSPIKHGIFSHVINSNWLAEFLNLQH